MFYKLLSYLFRNDDPLARYTPKPWHIFYSVLLMALGTVSVVRDGWFWFGLICFLLGVSLGVVIDLCLGWDKAAEYWDTINQNVKLMMSIKDPNIRYEIWKSMGYNFSPTNATVTERKEGEFGEFIGLSNKTLPVSPEVMQMIADKVLFSKNLNFKEEEFRFVPKFRKVKKYFETEKLITQNHKTNPRFSHSFNRKGLTWLYQFASEGVKLELKRRNGNE